MTAYTNCQRPKPPRKRQIAALLTGVYGEPEPSMTELCGKHLEDSVKPMPKSRKMTIGFHTHTAVSRLMRGQAIPEDLAALAMAANVSMLLCERGIGPEHMDEVTQAQTHIAILMRQMTDTGRPRPTGPMLNSLRRVLDISEEQVEHPDCTQAVIEACATEFRRRVASGAIFEVTKD